MEGELETLIEEFAEELAEVRRLNEDLYERMADTMEDAIKALNLDGRPGVPLWKRPPVPPHPSQPSMPDRH